MTMTEVFRVILLVLLIVNTTVTMKSDTFLGTFGAKGDVYVEDGKNTVYDIEMQKVDTHELPKRSRYYQAMIDLNLIEKGDYYAKLKKSYVIFICLDNPFDTDLPILDIALLVGFNSAKVYTASFRAVHAMTPAQFRASKGGSAL